MPDQNESVSSLYVSQNPGDSGTGCPKNPAFLGQSGFAKMGPAIMFEVRITLEHLWVYWVLAKSVPRGKNRCTVGLRWLAKFISSFNQQVTISKTTVSRRIEDLIEWGHLIRHERFSGGRATYELTDPAFLLVRKDSIGTAAEAPTPELKCVTCEKIMRRPTISGKCGQCGKFDDGVRRYALASVKLGTEDHETITAYLEKQKDSKRWRRVRTAARRASA